MKLIHNGNERIILRLADGTILTVHDTHLVMKCIPGRKKSERKTFEFKDMLVVNDALRRIYPEAFRPPGMEIAP